VAAVRLPLKNDIYTGFISFNAGMAKTIRSKFEQNYRISCHSLFFGKGRLKKIGLCDYWANKTKRIMEPWDCG